MKTLKLVLAAALLASSNIAQGQVIQSQTAQPIRVAIVGLVHGHVSGFLHNLPSHPDVMVVGVSEPDAALRQQYIRSSHLPANIFYADESEMLKASHPQAILVYTSPAGHRAAIETAASMHISAMVEKPLATTVEDALAIQRAAQKYNIQVLTNYETTWYASNIAAANMLAAGQIGELRKIVVHDGHRGPKEIGVGPEFLGFLADPKLNGAGALFDFGCYGADLATWMQHGELPLTVTAVTLQIKPQIYPNVDDDSTVILTYPKAQVILQGSWNWPFDRKDMEVYGAAGYVDTVYVDTTHTDSLRVRLPHDRTEHPEIAPTLPSPQDDSLHYLSAVLNGTLKSQSDLTALDTNIAVVRILDAARRSAQTGKTVRLADEVAGKNSLYIETDIIK